MDMPPYFKREDVAVATGWHVTRAQNLIARNDHRVNAMPNSNGILRDGGLRYGSCTHGGLSGVNFFTYFPTHLVVDDYVCLKIDVIHGTRLKGGSGHRLCSRGVFGELARTVTVRSVVFPRENAWEVAQVA